MLKNKKISTRNKKNRKMKEETNAEKNNKNKGNFFIRNSKYSPVVKWKKILIDNKFVHTNNSYNCL